MFSKLKSLADRGDASTPSGDNSNGKDGQEESLTTVLPTREDRAELLLLIAGVMQEMRTQISDAFDPTKTAVREPLVIGPLPGQENKASDEEDVAGSVEERSRDEKVIGSNEGALNSPENTAEPLIQLEDSIAPDAAESKQEQTGTVDGTSPKLDEASKAKAEAEQKRQEKERKALESRKKDLARPENVELKQASLKYFDDWRDKVLQRIGEAINQREEAEETAQYKQTTSRPSSREQPPADADGREHLQHVFPPLETPLRGLSDARRILIMHSILLLLLGLQSYPAESRVLMLRLTSSLNLSMDILAQDEMSTAKGLLEVAKAQMNADEETKKKADENSTARKWKVGLGAVAGAVLIGVTGGLAAPLLAAGVGSVMGGLGLGATATAGYLGALAGSAPLVGVLFGAYGGRMTGKMIDEYAKEVEDFAFIPVHKRSLFHRGGNHDDKTSNNKKAQHLRVAIGISGWLGQEEEIVLPWQAVSGRSTEAFALRWELKALLRLGHALNIYIKSYAWGFAKKEILSRTIFASIASALVLPYGLAKAARLIDNPFSVAMSRSDKAGAVLADALINKVQGERPVTLMGYSLGARVIYACLNELAQRKALGLVESVCLIGAPVPSDPVIWRRIRAVVAGRVVNVYSTKDYLLALLYRANNLQYGIAGLQAICEVGGVENVDVSQFVSGHTQYRFLVGPILEKVGLEDIDGAVVERQLLKLKKQEKEDEEARERSEADAKEKGKAAVDEAEEMEREMKRAEEEEDALEKRRQVEKSMGQMSLADGDIKSR
ncbi:hypothetical protein BD289DRAFT_449112 [Coniella lustricola]|uniref:DUF726-domain-containing protein n=1 Tax=Coniella lustricola TaxID=2025994 RepID=A0A2T3ANP1_9PEZI|nr:hypothetical protein BD289DRAFT_449112 [Coniella lustricola]